MTKSAVQSLEKLQTMVSEIEQFHTRVYVDLGVLIKEIKVMSNSRATYTTIQLLDPGIDQYEHIAAESLAGAFTKIPEMAPGAIIHLGTMQIAIAVEKHSQDWVRLPDGENRSYDDLYQATLSAWSDIFQGRIQTNEARPETIADTVAARALLVRNFLMPFLMGGAVGMNNFNDLPIQIIGSADLTSCDLSKQNLNGLRCAKNVSRSNFDGASLEDACFYETRLEGATFRGANLKEASFRNSKAKGADFEGANLTGARLGSADFSSTNLKKADLSKADLIGTDLRGADLSGAKINGAKFDCAQYDEHTTLPKGFAQTNLLYWRGVGPDPFDEYIKNVTAANFDEFVEIVKSNFEKSRMDTVAKMLKKEKFELYSDVEKRHITGVVKSQTNPELIYSCWLHTDGKFACCTQNLRPCGGLKGGLCKHILLLVVGLTKNERMNPTDAVRWVMKSFRSQPDLDKKEHSEIFLKYQASQAGEIDWRPTETIPEDYYAF